ncbi:MAG TPA: hypothetical protein VG407_03225 [Caulobacteraceae bacterium]|jgi:hypothetical protein|nr:hypothetical protein [Caulobacteraceae bacterium]
MSTEPEHDPDTAPKPEDEVQANADLANDNRAEKAEAELESVPGPAPESETAPQETTAPVASMIVGGEDDASEPDKAAPEPAPAPHSGPTPAVTAVPMAPMILGDDDEVPDKVGGYTDLLDRYEAAGRPMAVALLGMPDAGKTFLFDRIRALAEAEEGCAFNVAWTDDPGGLRQKKFGDKQKYKTTTNVTVYGLTHEAKPKNDLWIVDVGGEFFNRALETDFEPQTVVKGRIGPALALCNALILMMPARDALIEEDSAKLAEIDRPNLGELTAAVVKLARILNFMNARIHGGDLKSAVEELTSLDADELRARIGEARGMSGYPLLLLLSQADLYVDAMAEDPYADADPFLTVARRHRSVISHLRSHFEFFKIDFVTACNDAAGGEFDKTKESWGVWDALKWIRRTIRARNNRRLRWFARTDRALHLRWLLDPSFRKVVPWGGRS